MDAIDRAEPSREEPAERSGSEPEPEPVVTPPEPIATEASYPRGASGNASVMLELVIDAQGRVTRALAISGERPFAAHAVAAARRWRFRPATRDGKPVEAKLRFLLRFTEPAPAPEAQPEPPAAPARPEVPAPERE
ncbi:MAG: TonB family protein, partial [Pseudolabrys sp.]